MFKCTISSQLRLKFILEMDENHEGKYITRIFYSVNTLYHYTLIKVSTFLMGLPKNFAKHLSVCT